MLLKVSLIVAILASIGTLVLSHLQVADKVKGLQDDLQTTRTDLGSAKKEVETAKKDFKKAKEEAEKTTKELAEAQSNLESAMSNWKTQQDRADRSEKTLKQRTTELTEAAHELTAWKALNIAADQVRTRMVELDKVRSANDALAEEKKVMARKIADLKRQVDYFVKDKEEVIVMEPMKGKVVAVDPKWDFVIINVGSNQGAQERGELMVSREGKLVAKVRIARVEADRSIANVLTEWKQTDVLEGDQVFN